MRTKLGVAVTDVCSDCCGSYLLAEKCGVAVLEVCHSLSRENSCLCYFNLIKKHRWVGNTFSNYELFKIMSEVGYTSSPSMPTIAHTKEWNIRNEISCDSLSIGTLYTWVGATLIFH